MKRLAIVAALVLLSIVGTFGVYAVRHARQRASERSETSGSAEYPFTSATGDFSATFPERPTESDETLSTPAGPRKAHAAIAAAGPDEGYSILVADDLPHADELPAARLERLFADVVRQSQGTELARSNVRAGSTEGRELRVQQPARYVRLRLFVAEGHVYQVLVTHRVAPGDDAADDRFLQSFALRAR
ncbi:MAG: hypothetical protein HOO96_37275 [Polyangiaceae bacterium]|nr:hypothetical protein [Polyangiaceae bacterium]